MDAIVMTVMVGEDRRLVVDLPPEVPTGQVDVVITPHAAPDAQHTNPAREIARAKLLAAGALSTAHRAPEGTVPLSDEALQRIGRKVPGAKSIDQLIDEDRGDY